MRRSIIPVALLIVTAILLATLWVYSGASIAHIEQQGAGPEEFARHYLMIARKQSGQWQEIYEAAREAAAGQDALVEWVGMDMGTAYTQEDDMKIAIASRPDGILLCEEPGEELAPLINEAVGRQIPVVLLLSDDGTSKRTSYVGINHYQMGEMYGKEALEALEGGSGRVMLLMGSSQNNTVNSLMYAQILHSLEEGRAPGQSIDLESMEINTLTSFDAEEDIRDIFLQKDRLPKVLICLDAVTTECAAQAVVDYNAVGDVSIIGYYASRKILEAVERGLVRSTMQVDADQIGSLGVRALEEYLEDGHVSDYFNVSVLLVTQENVREALREEEHENA